MRALPVALLVACGGDAGSVPADAPTGRADAPRLSSDAGASCGGLPAAPSAPLRPAPGELFYAQLGLGGLALGEAALVVGPDGTSVLIDAGNDSHADDVRAAVVDLTGRSAIDHVLITHFHADHGGGLADLLAELPLTGALIHRGLTDLHPAANADVVTGLCSTLADHPGAERAMCTAATRPPCAADAWVGTYPAIACDGLGAALALGGGAELEIVAGNGTIGVEAIAPLRTDDGNGENARSLVAVLRHGAFRMLVAGDLTGGGSDTDDVEGFYAPRLPGLARGVDVLHLGHHGSDTSSSDAWLDRLLPADGRARTAIMGVSTAHLGLPRASVLDAVTAGDRLGGGAMWTTRVAPGGASTAALRDADGGRILIATLDGGAAYAIQAVDTNGDVLATQVLAAVGCP